MYVHPAYLLGLPLRMAEVERRRGPVVQNDLQLDLGLPLRRDLLALDVGVLVADGEGLLGAHHPAAPLAHQVERAVVLLVADVRNLRKGI